MPIDLSKSQIIQLTRHHRIRPHKRLGQNFLIDKNIINKIINSISPKPQDIFLEIGAGLGALTFPLARKSAKVVAFEIDKKLYGILKETSTDLKNIKVIHQDFLKSHFSTFKKIRVVGNIPYSISSLIIEKLVENKERIEDIHIMTQKEFADRLVARPKANKDYSSLTLFANYHFVIKKLFVVKKTCFWPQPKVDSVILQLRKRLTYPIKAKDEKLTFDIIRSAFSKRRKTILNSLTSSNYRHFKKEFIELALEKAKFSSRLRAENLSLEDFIKLANIIKQL